MKILFVNPFGIGDVLFTTSLFKPLKERGNSIYYWCNERVPGILRHNKAVEAIFSFSRGDLKRIFKKSPGEAIKGTIGLIKKIKNERFDMALDFSLDYRYGLLLRVLGVKRVAGFDYKGRGRFLTDKIKIDSFKGKHIIKQYEALLKFINRSMVVHSKMELFMGDDEKEWANEILSRNGISANDVLIGIVPGGGASWGKSAFRKHWPKEKFTRIIEKLMTLDKYKIILLGDEKETELCDFISDRAGNNIVNLCGKTTLGQLAAVLERCKLLVTNDGGPLHMASALGLKTVSIFGPGDEAVYGPYPSSSDHIVITSNVDCRPCYKNFRYQLCQVRKCLDDIEPSTVLKAIGKSLI